MRLTKWLIALVLPVILIVAVFDWRTLSKSGPRANHLKLPLGQVVPAVSIGAWHGIVLASDGSLWSWGESDSTDPVLGLGTITNQPVLQRIGRDFDWRNISAGSGHNLAIKLDGSLWAWGNNEFSQLGDGTTVPQTFPVHSLPGNVWQQVSAGDSYSMAIKKDGSLWAWGLNDHGQLGIGTTNNSPIAVRVGTGTNWTKVCATSSEAAGLQSDGSLWVWGDCSGAAATVVNSAGRDMLIPTRLSFDGNWVDFAWGFENCIAIKSDGSLWGWGGYKRALAAVQAGGSTTMLVRLGSDTDWLQCRQGGAQALIQKKDGSIWTLEVPRLNHHHTISWYPRFQKLNLQDDVTAYGAGLGTCAVLSCNGKVWTWGMPIGDPHRGNRFLQFVSAILNRNVGTNVRLGDPQIHIDKPWQLGISSATNSVTLSPKTSK